MKQAVLSTSGNFWGLTAEHIFITFSGFRRAAYKSRFVVLGSAPCPAEVCMTSSVSCTCFPHPPCASASLYISKFESCLQAMIPLMKATYFGCICIVWSFSVSLHIFLSLLSPVMFISPFKLTVLCTSLSPDTSSCQSLLLALRPVLLSTKLSSFSRLGGIIPSPPRTGLLLMVLQALWGGTGKAMGCKCLDGDGEGRRIGWQTSTEGLLCGISGALSMSLCFRQLAAVLVLWWRVASLVGLGLPSQREILLSVSCGQIWHIKMNCKRCRSRFSCQESSLYSNLHRKSNHL